MPNGRPKLPDALAAHAEPHGHAHHPALQHHFQTMAQQQEAATLGMWVFLVTEVMFFGGLLMAYLLYRVWYPEAWSEGSLELDIRMGGFNTVVLIGSSLTMALAVRSAQTGAPRATVRWLLLTIALGLTFLVVKFFEYKEKYDLHHIPGPNFVFEGPQKDHLQIFFSLYFGLTGLHALHMVIGVSLLSVITWMAHRRRFSPEWYTPVEMSGLYWHFVDIVWIFLFPLLYLVDRAHQLS
ncbi:MAG: cytochrome c oxidase subunit 3 family protein [Acidobacteria bacterium]|nr:cytochrome c oxidase subunit 3 family protein [Acidobacteriota bacterium]